MIESWVLIEEENANKETLRSLSLMNAKHLLVGSVPASGIMLHIAATTATDLGNALLEFAKVPGVKKVLTLALQTGR